MENYCFAKKRKEFLETRAMELSKDLKFLTQANENDLPIYERGKGIKSLNAVKNRLTFCRKNYNALKPY